MGFTIHEPVHLVETLPRARLITQSCMYFTPSSEQLDAFYNQKASPGGSSVGQCHISLHNKAIPVWSK